jgi:hypothetical protein
MKYKVEIKNEFLGNSTKIMTMKQLATFNLVAKELAVKSSFDGKPHTSGMWTVTAINPSPEDKG